MSKPVHIDDAIAEADRMAAAVLFTGEAATHRERSASLTEVAIGQITTDDRQRADRMTRALAALRADDDGRYPMCPVPGCRHIIGQEGVGDDCAWIEARRWVDANPEVAS